MLEVKTILRNVFEKLVKYHKIPEEKCPVTLADFHEKVSATSSENTYLKFKITFFFDFFCFWASLVFTVTPIHKM